MAWTTSATLRGGFAGTLGRKLQGRRVRPTGVSVTGRPRDRLTALLWLSATLHALLLARHATSIAEASASHAVATPGTDPLALAAVLTGLMVAVVLMRRGSRRGAFAPLGFAAPPAPADLTPCAAPSAAPASAEPVLPTAAAVAVAAPPEVGRLRTWSELSLHVSHEMRTPLNAVIGFTDVMHRELHGPVGHDRYREYLGHIRSSGEALLKATEDTLAVTQLLADPTPRQTVALGLRDCLAAARERVARAEPMTMACDLEWSLDVATDLAVEVEPQSFRQAIANLLVAARRHAGSGGRVAIRASASHGAVALDVRAAPRAGSDTARQQPGDETCVMGDQRYPLSLARALLELQGADLAESRRGPALVLTVMLTEATQHDMALFG